MAHLHVVPKVIPINTREKTRERLIEAVGQVLACKGFKAVTEDMVAARAGTTRRELFRLFHGLEGLVAAFGRSTEFWPPASELIGQDRERIKAMAPGPLMAEFFKRYLEALLRRPTTLDILAWEAVERNDLTRALEEVRARTALEFFELMDEDPPKDVDLTALVMLMAGAVNFLAVGSRVHRTLGGVDLHSERGWARIQKTIDQVMRRVLE